MWFRAPYQHHILAEINFLQGCRMEYSFSGKQVLLILPRVGGCTEGHPDTGTRCGSDHEVPDRMKYHTVPNRKSRLMIFSATAIPS